MININEIKNILTAHYQETDSTCNHKNRTIPIEYSDAHLTQNNVWEIDFTVPVNTTWKYFEISFFKDCEYYQLPLDDDIEGKTYAISYFSSDHHEYLILIWLDYSFREGCTHYSKSSKSKKNIAKICWMDQPEMIVHGHIQWADADELRVSGPYID